MVHRVTMLAFEGVNLLDIAGPLQAFGGVQKVAPDKAAHYQVRLVSEAGGPVTTSAGIAVHTEKLYDVENDPINTLMAPGGSPNGYPETPAALCEFVRRKAGEVDRLCSVCTGAFVLAEAGVLKGRRTATHWAWVDLFRARYPEIQLDSDAIFVRDGQIWGSAGVTAGIDLTLALIQQDLGYAISIGVARQLVVFLKRPGGQSQFSATLASQASASPVFAELHARMSARLKEDLRVERLAERCGMSTRTFARAYSAQVGETPARTVETMRLEAARRALEDGRASLKRVAVDAGYGDEQNLRRAFVRRLGVTPLEYRARFANPQDVAVIAR